MKSVTLHILNAKEKLTTIITGLKYVLLKPLGVL